MMDELMEKILPEINDWETLIGLLHSSHPSQINIILQKASPLVNLLDLNNLDKSPMKDVEKALTYYDLENLFELCHDSFFGNLIWLDLLIEDSGGIIESSMVKLLKYVPKLEYIEDIVFIRPNFGRKMLIRLNEDLPEGIDKKEIITALRLLMQIDVVELDKELISSFKTLLRYSQDSNDRKVLMLIELLEKCDIDALIREYKALTGKPAEKLEDLDLKIFYERLIKVGCPVFFNQRKIKYNGVVYNGNFFPLKYVDVQGSRRILKPFEQIPIKYVQKLHNPIRDIWFHPQERPGKIALDDIFTFREISRVHRDKIKSDTELISKIGEMSEDDIENKIRSIVGEIGSTKHTPIEEVDVFLCKIRINNEHDLRNAGIVIKKGSKRKQITLRDLGHQLLKAVDNDAIDLIILIHIAPIADDVRTKLINLCNKLNKMYCIVDVAELARLLTAYNMI